MNKEETKVIKVGLVEDQLLFREGIKAILSIWGEIDCCFESEDGFLVIEKLNNATVVPDVMLVDLNLPLKDGLEFNGIHVIKALNEFYPEMKTIVLSIHDDEHIIAQLIENGAHGYLVKDSDPKEVYNAIGSVYSSGSYINERTLKAIQGKLAGKVKTPKHEEGLSKRELEILELVCQQLTASEIGDKLFISEKTVNGHRNNLLQKTGSRNVAGLVMYAIKNRLVELI